MGRARWRGWVALLAAWAVAGASSAAMAGGPRRLSKDSFVGQLVFAAQRGARVRLARRGCARLAWDFADASGQPLAERLIRLDTSFDAYVGDRLIFYDGSELAPCQRPTVVATTLTTSPAVFVCLRRFEATYRESPRLGEAILIHEALHSLGLGENPPSSSEITAQVFARCH